MESEKSCENKSSDFKVTHTKSNLIQGNEYYPFGMQTASSWTRESVTGNRYLANGGTEMNSTTGVYDLYFRNYDPALGRMSQVDPMASKYGSITPYNYSLNSPSNMNDPLGDDVEPQRPEPREYICAMCWREGNDLTNYMRVSGGGGYGFGFGGSGGGSGGLSKYWHPGDGRMFWSGYESYARSLRFDADAVKNGDMFLREYGRRNGVEISQETAEKFLWTPTKYKLSLEGERFVKSHESFRSQMYNDKGKNKGNATIGWGHKIHDKVIDGKHPKEKEFKNGITLERGNEIFDTDKKDLERVLNNKLGYRGLSVTQNQFDALFSLGYNAGPNSVDPILKMMSTGQSERIFDFIEHHAIGEPGHIPRRLGEALMFSDNYYAPQPQLIWPNSIIINGND